MPRLFKDLNTSVTTALPAAAGTANATAIDLGETSPGVSVEDIDLLLEVPAVPALVDAKTIIYTVQDSADNSSFAAIAALATVTSLGAGGAGAAAVSHRVKLPPAVRRYVRVSAAVLAAGGDNTGVSFTVSLRY